MARLLLASAGMVRVDDIDLAELARALRATLDRPATGYVRGKTDFRDLTVQMLGCSELQAEELVDTMAARGFISYDDAHETAESPGVWVIRPTLA